MNYRPSAICLALLSAFSANALGADETPGMEIVVVSGSRAVTKLSETPSAIGVVTGREMERDKPKTMGDILNRVAGVHWNDLGNEQHSMAIRQPIGTGSVYQYLEDGIPIRPLGVFNHNSLNEMNIAGSDSVEVVKGPASSLYGSNAVGGAINALTAAPSRSPYARIGARHEGVSGFTRYDTAASNTWGDFGLRFSHYSSRRTSNNWQEYSYGDKDSFTLRADYALGNAGIVRATLVRTDLDAAMSGSLFENDYQNNPGKSLNTFTYRKDKTTRGTVAWEGDTTPGGTTTVTLFTRRNDHGQIPSYTIGSCAGSICKGTLNNSHVDSRGLDVKHLQEFAWLNSRLVTGIYIDRSDNPYYSDNLRIVRDPASGRYLSYTRVNDSQPQGVRDYQADIDNTAFFAQWEASPLPKLRVVAGGRSDRIRYDFRNNLSPQGSANYGAPNESRSFSRFSPKLGASYVLGADANAYANISEGFTPPEVSQMYGKAGIPDLQPATYRSVEVGLRLAFLDRKLRLDSSLYRLVGRDTIVSYTITPGNSENRNAGRTRSQGLELGLNYDNGPLDARFSTAIASHRYERYRVSATQDFSGKDMPQAPRDMTSAEIGYKPIPDLRIALEAVHQGAYWMDNANTVRYPGHALFHLRAAYRFMQGWEAWVHVRNLGDKHYSDSASSSYSGVGAYSPNTQNQYTPGAPRSVMLGLSYTFGGK
ncbi:TonB-dependent receptor [Massilia sp. MB5]|uniref:TonB-dependent receptor family protein n=1 Tax=Massilia sp. MB5 TaxID=2919578 RepID=UPI001F109C09|nr:TonB-dependent receptor [Massilia sp. MB5]UMR33146.1 TonB-dependent receptor [Massilia sp. MB5]